MSIYICVSDFWCKCIIWQISGDNQLQLQTTIKQEKKCKKLKRCKYTINGISAYYLLREIHDFTQFRLLLWQHAALKQWQVLCIRIVPPEREIIDYKWNRMLSYKIWEHVEVDCLMSWLSTLGGGFSALGEEFTKCAETAGKISLRQLAIGLRLGDPFLQARCKLFYSISLIQRGALKQAKHIVREQYKFASKHREIDGRLVKMCQGIWLRLQWEYALRLKAKQKQLLKH